MSDFACDPFNWALAPTEITLPRNTFWVHEIPAPSACQYRDHAEVVTTSDGRQLRVGQPQVTFLWDVLTSFQLFAVRTLIDQALATATALAWITFDRGEGLVPGRDWVDARAIPHPPVISQAGPLVGRIGAQSHFTNVQVLFNRVELINIPSSHAS